MGRGRPAVVVHVFHLDVWDKIHDCLAKLDCEFDLHITCDEKVKEGIRAALSAKFSKSEIHALPNRGLDVLPFLEMIPTLVRAGYSQVLKLHTKKGTTGFGAPWGRALIEELVGNTETFLTAERLFSASNDLSIVGPAPFFLSGKKLMLDNEQSVRLVSKGLGCRTLPDSDWGFFAGTMFWSRPEVWSDLSRWALSNRALFSYEHSRDGRLEHALERLFGLLPWLEGGKIVLLHQGKSPNSTVAQIAAPNPSLINAASSRELVKQYESIDEDVGLSSTAGLIDLVAYRNWLAGRGLDDATLESVNLTRHFLLIGRFSGAQECSPAWKCRAENDRLPWVSVRKKSRVSNRVSIVMPVYNQLELTVGAIEAVLGNSNGVDLELILVDNGSDEPTWAGLIQIGEQYVQVRVVRSKKNKFFALGSNIGFMEASGEFIVFLNNDTTVHPGWLEPLLSALKQPDAFAAQPLLLYPDGTVQCMGVVFSDRSPLGYPIYREFPGSHELVKRGRRFQAVTAACMAIRADAFAEVNGFDPIYVNGQEDVDLCLRIGKKTGKTAAYVPESRVTHHESKTKGRFDHVAANRRVFVQRWGDKVQPDDVAYYQEDGLKVVSWCSYTRHAADIAIHEPIFEGFESIGLAKERFSSILKRANAAFRAGRYELAERLYEQCMQESAKNRESLAFNLALTRKRLRAFEGLGREV